MVFLFLSVSSSHMVCLMIVCGVFVSLIVCVVTSKLHVCLCGLKARFWAGCITTWFALCLYVVHSCLRLLIGGLLSWRLVGMSTCFYSLICEWPSLPIDTADRPEKMTPRAVSVIPQRTS